jgi:hypothetical protein
MNQRIPETVGNHLGEDKGEEQARYAAEALARADRTALEQPAESLKDIGASDSVVNWGGGDVTVTHEPGGPPFTRTLAEAAGLSSPNGLEHMSTSAPSLLRGRLTSSPLSNQGVLSGVDAIVKGWE